MEYKKHRFNIYPEMQAEEFERLRTNIFVNGYDLKQPIWLFEGEIIDGWNRYRACQALGFTPVTRDFEGSELDAMQFVVRTNDRRDLSSSQRAAIAIEAEDLVRVLKEEAKARQVAHLKQGDKIPVVQQIAQREPLQYGVNVHLISDLNPEQRKARTQLAETFGTNRQYIQDVAKIKAENPEAFEAIKAGAKTITQVKQEDKRQRFEERKQEFLKQQETDCSAYSIHGQSEQVLKEREFPKFSLMLTDPPYGMDFKSGYVDPDKWERIANDQRQDTIDILHGVFSAALLHLEDDAHIYVFGNPMETESIKPIFEKYFVLKNILVWDREVIGMGDLKTYGRSYDIIYFGYYKKWKELNGTRDRDILRFPRVAPNNLKHPTEKPLDILEYLIKKSSNPGENVIDPFAGSFTTCEAATNTGRNSWGIELNEKYIPEWTIRI
jgi:site-specific DNA-methyltransferase (adenine-specific)